MGASICFIIGYLGIKQMYDSGVGDGATLPALLFASLVACSFVTGMGSNAAINAVLNTTAKKFPSTIRATAAGLVLSGLGLSAFWLTTLAYALFPGNTSAFLLILALGTAFPTLAGLLIIRSVSLPPATYSAWDAANEGYEPIPVVGDVGASVSVLDVHVEADPAIPLSNGQEPMLELDTPVSRNQNGNVKDNDNDVLQDICRKQLCLDPDFHLLFMIMGISFWGCCHLSSVIDINNVGAISQALYAKTHAVYDDIEASKWQAAQVSILSLGNFAGRIAIGSFLSDFTHTHLRFPRAYCLCIVSSLFIISQATAIAVSSVKTLWIATLLSGFAYGSLFGSFPAIMIDRFGMAHFSENWGYLLLSSPIGANLFSLLLGYNLDTHIPVDNTSSVALGSRELPSEHQCFDGKACYLGTLQVTLVACIVSLGLSWWVGIRDGQKARVRNVCVRE
ncbi:hypothetical protein JVU11DRAFT_6753 [Chiua virens]|nr:hypothetical protein JVU11DRAFT_6753 [Chiua virens]